jgi:hypothetical protein
VRNNAQQYGPISFNRFSSGSILLCNGNRFVDNVSPTALVQISSGSNVTFMFNEFRNNTLNNYLLGVAPSTSELMQLFMNNTFENNSVTNTIRLQSNGQLVVNYNRFANNQVTDGEVYVEYENIDVVIDGRFNYWNVSTEDALWPRIYDRRQNGLKALFEFWPFLLDNQALSSDRRPFAYNCTLVGSVDVDTMLNGATVVACNSTYIVTGLLTVLPNATLTVGAGVTLQFLPWAGLYIQGALVVRGTANERISFISSNPSSQSTGRERLKSGAICRLTNLLRSSQLSQINGSTFCSATPPSTPPTMRLATTSAGRCWRMSILLPAVRTRCRPFVLSAPPFT